MATLTQPRAGRFPSPFEIQTPLGAEGTSEYRALLQSDGIMSHSAIISREYGSPAVTGTGNGISRIKTGDTITVDGTNGLVSIHGE